jgi:hemolysin-activating ACP:hemolysin acyltransferase
LNDILEYGNIISKLIEALSIKQFDVLCSSAGAPYGYAIGNVCNNETRNIYVYSGTPALYDKEIQKNYYQTANWIYWKKENILQKTGIRYL